MDKRLIGAAFVIFGIIAIIGSALFMFTLVVLGSGISAIASADPEFLAQAGTDAAGAQAFSEQMGFYILLAWLLAVSFLISSLVSVHAGVRKLREKARK